jgi:hypothetical protein
MPLKARGSKGKAKKQAIEAAKVEAAGRKKRLKGLRPLIEKHHGKEEHEDARPSRISASADAAEIFDNLYPETKEQKEAGESLLLHSRSGHNGMLESTRESETASASTSTSTSRNDSQSLLAHPFSSSQVTNA